MMIYGWNINFFCEMGKKLINLSLFERVCCIDYAAAVSELRGDLEEL